MTDTVTLTPELVEHVLLNEDVFRAALNGHTQSLAPAETTEPAIIVETWADFERSATDEIPTIIEGLWPEAAFGFVASPPKKGKTWLGISLGLSLATGKPAFGHFTIPEPRPVVYLALEGHRAAIRGRIGCLARGMGVNPDKSGALENLHIIYKPRGINLAVATWVDQLLDAIRGLQPALVIVDVLRAAAASKESSNDDFNALRSVLQPLTHEKIAIALLHHFSKLTEITKERTPGERMSGAGAMYGALDAGIFITGSEDGARKLRVEFELRDLATPEPVGLHLTGLPTGVNGGFIYTDAAIWEIEDTPDESDIKAPASEIAAYVRDQGGDIERRFVEAYFSISDKTLDRRLTKLEQLGIDMVSGRGRGAKSRLVQRPRVPLDPRLVLPTESTTRQSPDSELTANVGLYATNHAGLPESPTNSDTDHSEQTESAHLQGKKSSEYPTPPTEEKPSADATAFLLDMDELAATVDLDITPDPPPPGD